MSELQQSLARILELAQEHKEDCPNCYPIVSMTAPDPYCRQCHGSGQIPDPAYQGLVEAHVQLGNRSA